VEWEKIVGPGIDCPLGDEPFSVEEAAQALEDERMWTDAENAKESIGRAIGVESDGCVENEEYEKAVSANEELYLAWVESLGKEETEALGGVDPAEIWPFRVESKSCGT